MHKTSETARIGSSCKWTPRLTQVFLVLSFYCCFYAAAAQSLSRVRLCVTPWTAARQAPLSMGFSRQEYWSGLPCRPPGDLPNPGTKPRSRALQADSLLLNHQGSPVGFIPFTKWLQRDYSSYSPMPILWGITDFPGGASGKEPTFQCRRCKRCQFNPWFWKIPWRRKWHPTPWSWLGNPMDRGAWWATVYGVTKSQIRPKWLSTHTHTCEE